MENVFVTGGTGFLGSHCILRLLNEGYNVRTSVRNLKKEPELRATLEKAGAKNLNALKVYEADLTDDKGWIDAISGCDYVLHVASPFPMNSPKNEDDLIIPARDGTLRVLKAAKNAKVKRVVLTSSFAAIGYGHKNMTSFDEWVWTDLSQPIAPYLKSKTIAERAAWDYVENEGKGLELTVINPVGIFGPVLNDDLSASVSLVKMLLDGKMPLVAKLFFSIVDVRDVADIHVRAMTSPKAAGERFIAVNDGDFSLPQIAQVMKANLGRRAGKVSTKTLPDFAVRVLAMFNSQMKALIPQLGHRSSISNKKAKEILGWAPRGNEETILASADSILSLS